MDQLLSTLAAIIILLPLLGGIIAGIFGKRLGKESTHRVVISLIALAFTLTCYLFYVIVWQDYPTVITPGYTWLRIGMMHFDMNLLLDKLSVTMSFIVNFISFMVYVYTIGYMAEDAGYTRFFSYISLFTFFMLILVFADNFLLMFVGWEGVGLISYLLIGFWYQREAALNGSLKAFLANRIGDIGFVLAMAMVLAYFGTLRYEAILKPEYVAAMNAAHMTLTLPWGGSIAVLTAICLLLFVGAMGKSAQVPLHVWLPESMEGPTPISALIHAATMVTAGIYMVARMSPLFEYAPAALSVVLVIGASTCFFMGLLAVFQFDIKRVVAYSTLSQLGYMAVALGVSAYDAAIFHLLTHAFFKALLFLAAGSVIIAMHHEQDMRKMGGLAKYLPITYFTFLIGSLALAAIPPFAGFYSKDVIIEAAKLSTIPGAGYAYFCVQAGAFITALYTFRALFLTFHTQERFSEHTRSHIHESPWVVLLPLKILALASCVVGIIFIQPMLFDHPRLLGNSIFVLPEHDVIAQIGHEYQGVLSMAIDALTGLTFWLVIAGIVTAWVFNSRYPQWAEQLKKTFAWFYSVMQNKYGFDAFNQKVLVQGTKDTGEILYSVSDLKVIDGAFVNGSGESIRWFSRISSRIQTGYLNHYAFVMVIGLMVLLVWYVLA